MSDMDQDFTSGVPSPDISRDQIQGLWRQREFYRNMQVAKGIDGDADVAAQSQDLEASTGVPASLIAENHDEFVTQQKKVAAQQIVSANPDLDAYVMSHPLASTVSNDDWANLDKFTRESANGGFGTIAKAIHAAAGAVHAPLAGADQIADQALEGIEGGLKDGLPVDPATERALNPQTNTYGAVGAFATSSVFGALDIASRIMGAVGGGITGAAGGIGQAIGGSSGEVEARELAGSLMNQGMAESGMHMRAPEEVPVAPRPLTAMESGKPWFEAGEEPPAGVHPEIDEQKAGLNSEWLDKLEADFKNAQASTTRERSPELFQKLTDRMYGESSIGLHADAALNLYGDKPPAADDGLLGWVPNIDTQLMAARDIGSDVQIPLKDFMAKADPEVAKAIRDDLRIWPGGITVNEAKAGPVEPMETDGSVMAAVREGMGTQPLPEPAEPVLPTIEREGQQFYDTRGQGRNFHGSSAPELQAYDDHYSDKNYYGQGFYTTDAADVAYGYSKRGSKTTGQRNVHTINENRPLNILDGEQTIPSDVMRKVESLAEADRGDMSNILHNALDEKPKNLRELYDHIRDEGYREGLTTDGTQEIFDTIRYHLEEAGYDGISHLGGLRTNTPPHKVTIYFTPKQDLTLSKLDPNSLTRSQRAQAMAAESGDSISEPAGVVEGRAEGQQPIIEGRENITPAALGMDAAHFDKYAAALDAQAQSDLKAATTRAERDATKRQSKEWKANRQDMIKEVAPEIRQRPDIAADLFLGQGEMYGRKVGGRFTLDESKLTDEQKATLPDHYVSGSGFDPDQIAGVFGYSSGDEMVRALGRLEQLKSASGTRMRMEDFVRQTIQTETDRRMELRYGHLAAETLDAARDQALSQSSLNVQYERYRAVAESNGVAVFDREVIKQAAHNAIQEFPLGKISSYRIMQDMGRDARNAEKALLDGKFDEAAIHLQRQTMNMYAAAEARDFEKKIVKLDKDARTWGKAKFGDAKSSVAPEYANVIQQVLSQIGKKIAASPEYLTKEMQESGWGKDVRSFVDDKTKWGAIITPWEDMYNPKTRFEYKSLTAEQFTKADDFLRSLVQAGREEKKLYKSGVAADFAEKRVEMLEGLNRLDSVSDSNIAKGARTANALMIQMETYIDKLDRWDPSGVWNDYLLRPLFESEHAEMDRTREVTKQVHDIVKLKFDNQDIPSIFKNPRNGSDIVATRKSLWAAMLNQGAEDNRVAFAKSWGLKPEDVRAWIDQHAAKEDWDGVQKILDLFRQTGAWSDDEYRRLSGRGMQGIEAQPIKTEHGEYAGGYYPIMHHPDFPGKSANLLGLSEKGLFGSGYSTGFVPGAGYRIERTGYIAPMALDLDQVAGRLIQQIHDGAMRGALMQAAKILRDPALKDAMIEKLGLEVHDAFVKHLHRIASSAGPSADMSLAMQRVLGVGDYIRRNVISNMIGLNLGTVEKHGPTAFVTSLSQLGVPKMLDAYKDIWTGSEEGGLGVRKAIYEKSALMRGRQRYWQDSIYGSVGAIHDDNTLIDKFLRFREWSQWAATQPVAMSDALSAEPLWWGTYKDSKASGETEGDAVFKADKAVRKAHGAGGTVGQPLVVNEVSKWFTPMYNFYNSVLNKAVESYWRAGEARRNWSEGDYDKMKTNMKGAAVGGFVALIVPAVIHDIVSPPKMNSDDSWEFRILKYMAGPMAAFIPGGANVAEYLTGSSTPDVGLQTAAMKQAFDFARDLTHKHVAGPATKEKLIRDGGSMMGWLGVGAGRQLGAWAGGLYGMAAGRERPKSVADVHSMVRFGTIQRRQ